MLILQGLLRQKGDIETKEGKKFTKLWIEHQSEGQNGTPDLKIAEFMIPAEALPAVKVEKLRANQPISLSVRPFVVGRDVKFSATGIVEDSKGVSSN